MGEGVGVPYSKQRQQTIRSHFGHGFTTWTILGETSTTAPEERYVEGLKSADDSVGGLERGPQETRQLPAIHIFIGRLTHRVMAAWQHNHLVVEMMPLELGHNLF